MKTLKCEEVYLNDYRTFIEAVDRLPCFIDEIYKPQIALGVGLPRAGGSRESGARPPRAPLGQHKKCWPARRITRRPRTQNL